MKIVVCPRCHGQTHEPFNPFPSQANPKLGTALTCEWCEGTGAIGYVSSKHIYAKYNTEQDKIKIDTPHLGSAFGGAYK